jgi:hypothetical protein
LQHVWLRSVTNKRAIKTAHTRLRGLLSAVSEGSAMGHRHTSPHADKLKASVKVVSTYKPHVFSVPISLVILRLYIRVMTRKFESTFITENLGRRSITSYGGKERTNSHAIRVMPMKATWTLKGKAKAKNKAIPVTEGYRVMRC